MSFLHRPALVEEVVRALTIRPEGIYVDGTVGTGGHAEAILRQLGPAGRLIGVDCDDEALEGTRERLRDGRLSLVHGRYEKLAEVLGSLGVDQVDGLLLDLGVSSLQLSSPQRGFGFAEGPLDMRMDPSEGETAASLLQRESEGRLAEILKVWGEERFARPIACALVRARREGGLRSTQDLAGLVARVVPRGAWPRRIHPATRTFQALRIAVNRELDRLEGFLGVFPGLLRPGGRAAVIAYHSLEDRLVKQAFRRAAARGEVSLLTKKPIRPSEAEIEANSRARSARLRVAEKR